MNIEDKLVEKLTNAGYHEMPESKDYRTFIKEYNSIYNIYVGKRGSLRIGANHSTSIQLDADKFLRENRFSKTSNI
jgi:hypothetical protein